MLLRLLSVMFLIFAAGCGLKNIKAETYVMTQPRVDIEKGTGNAGYLKGEPRYLDPQKKTRKVYILELTKALPEGEVKKIEQEVTTTSSTKIEKIVPEDQAPAVPAEANHGNVNRIVIPPIEDTEPAATKAAVTGSTEAITYTVQKDDTLQKIAKKVYGSYGAWYKIYEANKDKIKNPNLLKSGTVITIPAAK